jgi:biotin transport system ATP-binding protein
MLFPAGNSALSNVSLEIREGECLFIAGSNGSGKTILMRIITGLSEPTAGEVWFRGAALFGGGGVSKPALAALRRSVGMVFQDADAQIIGETVAEDTAFGPANLKMPKAETASRVKAALEAVGLSGKDDYPPRRLSGGEKRRLAVAGILAAGCDTVIMDEPFANLDWPGVVAVLEIIATLKNSGKTVIVLSHELEKALAFADRLVILHQGLIRDDGDAETVLDRLLPEYGVRDPRHCYKTASECTWLET